jgi:cell division protein FtsB
MYSKSSDVGPTGIGPTGRPTVSWRVVGIIVIITLALAVVLPSLRAYSRQQDRLAELRLEDSHAREQVNELEAELARWDDPKYIVAQARERLSYVLPGETPYRVIDPETVVGPSPDVTTPTAPTTRDSRPWYVILWGSLENPESP